MYSFTFENLSVWQDTRVLVKKIYNDTRDFPDDEKFGLTNQIRRAALSVSSNIAEGSSRTTKKDQAHFYSIAYSSLMELYSQIMLANDLNYLKTESLHEYRLETEKIANKLNALRKSILK